MNYSVEYENKLALFCHYNDALVFCQELKDRGIKYTLSKLRTDFLKYNTSNG